jgi:virginiamycin B lyase
MFSRRRNTKSTTRATKIGRLTFRARLETLEDRCLPSGGITELPIPAPQSGPEVITSGPDGNLWFTEYVQSIPSAHVWRLTPSRTFSAFPLDNKAAPFGIITGPDNQLWFTEHGLGSFQNAIARMDTSGTLTGQWQVSGPTSNLTELTLAPDGKSVWFTQDQQYAIGK